MTQTAMATVDALVTDLRCKGAPEWSVMVGRAIEIMRQMPDGAVDVTITDPPYNDETHAHATTMAGGTPTVTGVSFDALGSFDFVRELLRVTRRWVLCFSALEDLGAYKVAAGGAWSTTKTGAFVRAGVWERPDGTPQITGDRPAQGAEGLAILHSRTNGERLRWNGGGHRASYCYGRVRAGRVHETQKPVVLLDKLITQYTDRGEIVFDPFGGSMTTGVAALKAERRFLGVDIAQRHCDRGARRLAAMARIVAARRD